MAKFQYHERTADDTKARADRDTGGFITPFPNNTPLFKARDGENVVRVLPATFKEAAHWGMDIWLHRSIGPDNATFLCLDKMKGKRCPCCEEAREMKVAGDVDEAKEIMAKASTVAYLIDRDDEKEGPQIWLVSATMDKNVAQLSYSKRTGKALLIDHPDNGYDLIFTRTGKGLKTRYTGISLERDPSPIHPKQRTQDEWLDFITKNPLDEVLVFHTADDMERELSGTSAKKDRDADGDKSSRGRGRDRDEDDKPRGRDRDVDDDKPARRSSRDEEEDRPARGRSRDEDDRPARRGRDDEDDKPARRSSRDDDKPWDDDKPARGRSRDDEDDRSTSRRTSSRDEDERPSRGRSSRDDEDDKPARRSSRDDGDDRGASRDRKAIEEQEGREASRARSRDEDEGRGRDRGRARDEDEDERPARRR